jgi:putative phosphoribosyl transferase
VSYEVLVDRPVWVPVAGNLKLRGDLTLPVSPWGIVLFAHGHGSSRFSARNRQVAVALQRRGLGTLLLDLLTANEQVAEYKFGSTSVDIALLGRRMLRATEWLSNEPTTTGRPVGYFGSGTGGAAALFAATRQPEALRAVVTRGARTEHVEQNLTFVSAPTLLIVGSEDEAVLAHNRRALSALRSARTSLTVVAGASHTFDEAFAMDRAADAATEWYTRHLGRQVRPVGRTTQPSYRFQ